ncbi:TolC family protein [bacterium]|nr:TolC family protein [bacterium]
MTLHLTIIALFAVSHVGYADSIPLTLKEIGRRASENAALIQAQTKDLESAQLEADGAGLLSNPAFSLQMGSLTSGTSTGLTAEGFLSQTIPFPGKLKSQRYLKEVDVKLTKASLDQAKTFIQHQAVLLGFQWQVLDAHLQHFQERKKRFGEVREYFKTHPQLSPATRVDAQMIEMQILLVEKRYTEMEAGRRVVERQLQYYLQSSDTVRPVVEWVDSNRVSIEALRKAVSLEDSPELIKKRLDIEMAKNSVDHNRLKALPDFTLGVGYRNEAVSPSNHFYYGSLGLTIPLFDRGQYATPAAEAKLNAETAREGMLRGKLNSEIESALIELESAKAITLSLPLKKTEALDSQFEQVSREFRKGRITTTAFLQADAQFHEVTDSIYNAQLNLAQSLSRLKVLVGQPLSWE